jgi:hypothetical protein
VTASYAYEEARATSSDKERAPPWMNVNETTCYVSSWTEGRGSNGTTNSNGSSSTTDLPLLTLTGVVPGCGAPGAGGAASSSFLSLNLLQGQQQQHNGAAAGGTSARNASGVFGKVVRNNIYSGSNYSLDLVVQLNVQNVVRLAEASLAEDDDFAGTSPGTLSSTYLPDIVVGYVRLVFCDALQMGSCDLIVKSANEQQDDGPDSPSPLLKTTDYTNYLSLEDPVRYSGSNNSSSSSSSNTVVPGPLKNQSDAGGVDATYLPLVGYSGGGDSPGVMSSPWLAITLRPLSSNGTYRARHVYTVSLAGNVTSGVRVSPRECGDARALVNAG